MSTKEEWEPYWEPGKGIKLGTLVNIGKGEIVYEVVGRCNYYGPKELPWRECISNPILKDTTSGKIRNESYVSLNLATEQLKEKEQKRSLYEVKVDEKVLFANYLATNSDGLWVMEEKGTGHIFTTKKEEAQEVLPFTIDVKFEGSANVVSYLSNKDTTLKVGDVLLINKKTIFAHVVAVDSKNRKAIKELKGRRVVTEEF